MAADLERVRLLLDVTHLAVVAASRPDGTVHASLVSAGILDDPISGEPSIAIVVAGVARKLDHFRRTGQATAVVTDGYRWASVEGPVRIIGPDDTSGGGPPEGVPSLLRRVFVAAGGTHDDWDGYDRVMAEQRRAAVFIHAARTAGNG